MMSANSKSAACTVNLIIVGAGFAGLAAAYTLSRSGHNVRVLDQQPYFGCNKTGGIKVGPNFTRALKSCGLADALAAITEPARRTGYISLETGEVLNYHNWDGPVMQSTGGELLLGLFDDVLRLFHDQAVHHGAEILYGKKVIAYRSSSGNNKPVVALEGGKTMDADCIINAAGLASLANISTEFESVNDWSPLGTSLYTTIISGDKMREDPELNELLQLEDCPAWMGSNRTIISYPIKQNTEYVLEIFWPDSLAKTWPSNVGTQWIDWSTDAVDFSGCEPRMDRLLKLATSLNRTRCMVRKEPLSDWIDETGRILVIGDAAHPLHPCMLSTVSLAVEDANALGILFSHIPSLSALPSILAGFQEVRQPAFEAAAKTELKDFNMIQLPPGPERDARDAKMRMARDSIQEPTEEELRAKWEGHGLIYTHDASEAAEDWWVKWGRFSAQTSSQK